MTDQEDDNRFRKWIRRNVDPSNSRTLDGFLAECRLQTNTPVVDRHEGWLRMRFLRTRLTLLKRMRAKRESLIRQRAQIVAAERAKSELSFEGF